MVAKKGGKRKTKKVTDYYDIGDTVGTGAFGVVKKCIQKSTGEEFAVKIMALRKPGEGDSGDSEQEASTAEEIKREIDILASISHPSIIHFEEFFEQNNKIYLVTELLTGGELLDALLDTGTYTEADARKCFVQLIQGLKYLHAQGVTHRDLKLENLLLARAGDMTTIKIGDFGLAKSLAEGQLQTVCGSPLYVAPEVVSSDSPGTYAPNVDIWSAGVVLFILLAGYPPFEDENEGILFEKICAGQYDFDDEAWDSISAEAKDLVTRLLTTDPKKRITADEALQHRWIKLADVGGGVDMAITRNKMKGLDNRFKKVGKAVQAMARFNVVNH